MLVDIRLVSAESVMTSPCDASAAAPVSAMVPAIARAIPPRVRISRIRSSCCSCHGPFGELAVFPDVVETKKKA